MRNGIGYIPTLKCREYEKTTLDVNDMKNLVVEIEEHGCAKEYAIDFKKFLKDYGIEKVYDSDDVEINIGDIVYGLSDGKEWYVTSIVHGDYPVDAISGDDVRQLKPEWLTHEKPDTQKDINEYLYSNVVDNLMSYGNGMYKNVKMVPIDVVEIAMERQHAIDMRAYSRQ